MVRPKYINFNNWAASLQIDYPKEEIPLVGKLTWEDWGELLANVGVFKEKAIPFPSTFKKELSKKEKDDWRNWASQVYYLMELGV